MNCSNNIEAILNTSDQPVYNDDDSCECGFNKEDSMFPENAMLGQSYVPTQKMDNGISALYSPFLDVILLLQTDNIDDIPRIENFCFLIDSIIFVSIQ